MKPREHLKRAGRGKQRDSRGESEGGWGRGVQGGLGGGGRQGKQRESRGERGSA